MQAAHENLPAVDEHYRAFLRAELDAWRRSNPRAVRFLQSLDHAAALARPAITVALFFTGLHFAGDLVGQAAAQAAGTTAGHLATEAAIAGGITGGGEALVSTTSEGVRQAAGRLFGRLNPATPSSAPAGWPSGSSANCSAICWPICAAARKCQTATPFGKSPCWPARLVQVCKRSPLPLGEG